MNIFGFLKEVLRRTIQVLLLLALVLASISVVRNWSALTTHTLAKFVSKVEQEVDYKFIQNERPTSDRNNKLMQRFRYARAFRKFPDYRSCLLNNSERVDWKRMRTQEQAYVCLFQTAAHFKDTEKVSRKLEQEGFITHYNPSGGSRGFVSSYWNIEKNRKLSPFSLLSEFGIAEFDPTTSKKQGVHVTLAFDANSDIITHYNIYFNSLLK
ncbi:hypothetical protein [Neptunicoccus cionae]|uniref:hypothetical protein n=1 Tax=Neptunicoccus cionae TaxID=2035344 RepID=UPI000C76E676|nr:hypothetical protein [Amylibacter cionae]PLS23429.1 hypothetical protein C0U40_04735 [Amylibacter cionae]